MHTRCLTALVAEGSASISYATAEMSIDMHLLAVLMCMMPFLHHGNLASSFLQAAL
jgi:hypothetical protein